MICYKVDPRSRTVTQHTFTEYNGLRRLSPYEWHDVCTLTQEYDYVIVNDTGLIDGTEQRDGSWYWRHDNGQWQKFAGVGIIFREDWEEYADPSLNIEQVRARVAFAEQWAFEHAITT